MHELDVPLLSLQSGRDICLTQTLSSPADNIHYVK